MEKKQKRIEGEFAVPEEIIQHIQSFMDETEAARTTLLSKSWYAAWSTRPNLNFDQYVYGFPEFTKKTMQRYEYLNLNIQTFSLRMFGDDSDLARELILKAIKLGAIDLTIDIMSTAFVLPDEVLESETLARLSAHHITVDLERMNKPLTSSNLKSLTLSSTVIIGDLSRRFPLLEELTVEGFFNPYLPFSGCTTKLHNLEFLQLERLNTEDSFSKSDWWLQFPCLKTLVIWNCHCKANGEDVIRICSSSLEFITITIGLSMFTEPKLEFDVPNIRKFKFNGGDVPRLELKTSSREWESDIYIICCTSMVRASWLRSLKQFVKPLSPSRVSLVLNMAHPVGVGVGVEDGFVGDGLATPAVENLTIMGFGVLSPAFLNALFWSCRPNFLTIERRCLRGIEKENVEQFQHLSSLPWNTLLDDSRKKEFVRFQLK